MSDTTYTQEQVNNILAGERREMEMKISEAEVARAQRLADLGELLDSHGFARADNETTEQAATRLLADLQTQNDAFDATHQTAIADFANKHQADIVPLRDRAAKVEARLTEVSIVSELTKAAQTVGAYNADQVITMLRPHTHQLGNGEVVVADFMPRALQSAQEAVEYLKDSQPNLFAGGL